MNKKSFNEKGKATIDIYEDTLQAVRLKYKQLVREIHSNTSRSDLDHTVSKLGIFLNDLLGDYWRYKE